MHTWNAAAFLNCCLCKQVSFWPNLSLPSQAVKQNPNSANSNKATPSRSGPVKKESIGAQYRHHPLRARRRPPKGMYLEQGDIMSVSASHNAGVLTIQQLDTQLVSLKRQVCTFRMSNLAIWTEGVNAPKIIWGSESYCTSRGSFGENQ